VDHPAASPPNKVTVELSAAIEYEAKHSVDEVDSMRRKDRLYRLFRGAKNMEKARSDWCEQASSSNKPVVEQIHGPLL
jgi:hypothetical protein